MTWVVGSELARGATAVVTRGDPGTVIKTFDERMPPIIAAFEAAGTRAAMAAGLPCARLISAELDATPPTLTFEFVDGEVLFERLGTVGADAIASVLAELQHQVRGVPAPEINRVEELLGFEIQEAEMPESLRAAALRDLARLTAHCTRVLCHGDLHDANVMWVGGDEGRPVLIDWTLASAGPAEADVARSRMLLAHEKYYEPDIASELDELAAAFVAHSERLSPGIVGASRSWDRVIAAARLAENPPVAEREAIVARYCP